MNKRIKHMAVCLTAIMFLLCSSMTVLAAEGTVKPSTAKIRSSADTASEAVASVKQNDKLEVVSKTTGADGNVWYKIQDGNVSGYIRSDLLTVSGEVKTEGGGGSSEQTVTETPADVTDSAASSGKIGSSSVNVRKGPASTDAVVSNLKAGAAVSITGETTGADGKKWYQVSFLSNNSNVTGFIRADLIDINAGEAEEPASGANTDTNAGSTAGDDTEAPTEAETEQPEETPQEQPEDYSQISNVISTRKLPAGTKLSDVELTSDMVTDWESDNYYILVTSDKNGNNQEYYLYRAEDGAVQQIDNPLVYTGEDAGGTGSISLPVKIAFIVLAAIVIILIVVVTMLALRLRDAEWEDEEDDEDDEDEEEEDGRVKSHAWKPRNFLRTDYEDDEDDEDEEEEERPVRRQRPRTDRREEPPRRAPQRPQGQRPVQRPRTERGEEPARRAPQRPQGQRPVQRPDGAKPPVRRNPEAERPVQPRTSPKKPSPKYYDEDDEFEFEFLNMDGKNEID